MINDVTIIKAALKVQNEFDYVNSDDINEIIEFLGDAELANKVIEKYTGYQREEIVQKLLRLAEDLQFRIDSLEKCAIK